MKNITSILAIGFALTMVGADVDAGNRNADVREPVSGGCTLSIPVFSPSGSCVLYTVPAGKRLVVQDVSYLLTAALTQGSPYEIAFGDASNVTNPYSTNQYFLSPMPAGSDGTGAPRYMDSRLMRTYLDENHSLAAYVAFTLPQLTSRNQQFNFSGYLVDK